MSPKGEGGSVRGTAAVGRRRQCPEPRSQLSPAVGRALGLGGSVDAAAAAGAPDRRTTGPGFPSVPRLVKPRAAASLPSLGRERI